MPKTIEKSGPIPMLGESAHNIWLAGLGVLSVAEDESGKLFKTLVKRGKAFETVAKSQVSTMRDTMRDKLDVRKAASDAADRFGHQLDAGTTGVLHRLGLPTKKEIDGLAKRVDRLAKTLESKPLKATSKRRAAARRHLPAKAGEVRASL